MASTIKSDKTPPKTDLSERFTKSTEADLDYDPGPRVTAKQAATIFLGMLTIIAVGVVLKALAHLVVPLLVAFFIQRPGVRRLLGLKEAATEEEKERWRARARRQRYISYGMAAAIGLIGWLMMSKPTL